jgi:hypothetical protein
MFSPELVTETHKQMGKARYRFINMLIGVLIAGSLFDIATRREHWPFSPYDLYTGASNEYSLTLLRLYGVTAGKTPSEFPLYAKRYIEPFDNARLRVALENIDTDPNRSAKLTEALRDCLRRYEALRASGRHDGPPLRGIRFYRVYWKLEPWARNLDFPDRKELLFEISQPSRG